MAELDYQGGVEDCGYFGEGAGGEVLVAGLYAGDHGLGGAYGFGQLALGQADSYANCPTVNIKPVFVR